MKHRLLVALIGTVALVSCGVPTETDADLAEPQDVPFGLLDEDRQPVTGDNPSGQTAIEIYLYAEDQDIVVPVVRLVERGSIAAAISELGRGPTDAESDVDLRSALTEVDAIDDVETSGGVAAIDLAESFSDIRGADQLIAIAQLVFTATARPGIGQVNFTHGGQPIEIPRGDGSLTRGTVTREDYSTLAPPA